MKPGWRTTEHTLAVAVIAGSLAFALKHASPAALLPAAGASAAYSIARSRLKAAELAAFKEILPMIQQLLKGLVESHLNTNVTLAPIQPELNAAIDALGALADKAVQAYGTQLLAKLGVK